MTQEKEIQKKAEEMTEENGLDIEVNEAYISIVGLKYAEAEEAEEAYQGEWASNKDFVQDLLEETGEIPELPFYVYIDWERTARDIMMDYLEDSGHYFRNL